MITSMYDQRYWLWLSLIFGPGSAACDSLLYAFGDDPKAIYDADETALAPYYGNDPKLKSALLDKRLDRVYSIIEFCQRENVGMVTPDSRLYPPSLSRIIGRPCVLYYKGRLPDFSGRLFISMVGTRNVTPYGSSTAYTIAHDLASAGAVVVSGMAIGADTAAHRGALDAQGHTIAFLGCGIDVVYPRDNEKLMREIIATGTVITDYPPGSRPEGWHFPVRNRLISGISAGVLVIEASEKSGALITAEHARRQGKLLYALPGKVGEMSSVGTNRLIATGAKIVLGAGDILRDFTGVFPHLGMTPGRPTASDIKTPHVYPERAKSPAQKEAFPGISANVAATVRDTSGTMRNAGAPVRDTSEPMRNAGAPVRDTSEPMRNAGTSAHMVIETKNVPPNLRALSSQQSGTDSPLPSQADPRSATTEIPTEGPVSPKFYGSTPIVISEKNRRRLAEMMVKTEEIRREHVKTDVMAVRAAAIRNGIEVPKELYDLIKEVKQAERAERAERDKMFTYDSDEDTSEAKYSDTMVSDALPSGNTERDNLISDNTGRDNMMSGEPHGKTSGYAYNDSAESVNAPGDTENTGDTEENEKAAEPRPVLLINEEEEAMAYMSIETPSTNVGKTRIRYPEIPIPHEGYEISFSSEKQKEYDALTAMERASGRPGEYLDVPEAIMTVQNKFVGENITSHGEFPGIQSDRETPVTPERPPKYASTEITGTSTRTEAHANTVIPNTSARAETQASAVKPDTEGLSETEKEVVEHLFRVGRATVDGMESLGIPVPKLLSTLTLLEIKRKVKQLPGGYFENFREH